MVAYDFHRAATQNVGGADHQWEADVACDCEGFFVRVGQAVVWLFQAKTLNQFLEAFTVFGQVDGVWCGAEDWDAFILKRLRDFQWGLAAELNDHTVQRAVFLFFG